MDNLLSFHLAVPPIRLHACSVSPFVFSVEVASHSVTVFICLCGSVGRDDFKILLHVTRAGVVSHANNLTLMGLEIGALTSEKVDPLAGTTVLLNVSLTSQSEPYCTPSTGVPTACQQIKSGGRSAYLL